MPRPVYVHRCIAEDGQPVESEDKRWCRCGRQPSFSHWRIGVIEGWGRHGRLYGMHPWGPGSLKIPLPTRPCEACSGTGFTGEPPRWVACPECDSTGAFLDYPEEVKEWIRRRARDECDRWREAQLAKEQEDASDEVES